ncbi:chemotaxis protein CheB [Rhodanobacter sp. B05]|uniref:chemotaxis protein CheB n=1 Tax=Rhodanobacter sp. B05 TaxID=1945859 RepID=UPI000985890E|nr:chemotaxis protein CheB [Rhodanobacter sp. B05]OOG59170.1 chemotaxis protein CheB [Rhodanobacter sp. B05]
MIDTPPAVALLFDDRELGGHLRDALHERGARIVHEGDVSGASRELLQQVGADVVVVNLDEGADDALDRLYEMLDSDRPRVVFNDAQASRALVGWDRARWARHLAVKVLAMGDVDPPRPEDAREVPMPAPAPATVVAPTSTDTSASAVTVEEDVPESMQAATSLPGSQAPAPEVEAVVEHAAQPTMEAAPAVVPQVESAIETDTDFPVHEGIADLAEHGATAESEDLAAELEALLASGDLPGDEDVETSGPGLRFTGAEEPPPLYDGNFGALEADDSHAAEAAASTSDPAGSGAVPPPFPTDHLQLSAMTDSALITESPAVTEPTPVPSLDSVRAPEGWSLVDEDAPAEPAHKPDPAAFGIQKLSAAEFLAPEAEAASPDVEPTMSLELVSLEEAIAPQAYVQEHEMILDDRGSALSRIVLLGAAVDGTDSVCAFLAAMPATTRLTFLLVQHLGGQSDAALCERFAGHCALPVRLADGGRRAGMGEVLMVPAGQQVRLRRDGSMELQGEGADGGLEPSIDASLTMAANAFGRDALAIVFAGRGNDAVAGAQAIHDRGGQVWVESSSGEHFADMVSGIFAERLVSYSGTSPELAAHLIEVFP